MRWEMIGDAVWSFRPGRAISGGLPANLSGAPMLLPTRNNALRARLEQWFEAQGIQPQIVGEFEDNALLMTFGRAGRGLFLRHPPSLRQWQNNAEAIPVGEIAAVREHFLCHIHRTPHQPPGVEAICQPTASSNDS